jgi:hypothetical protein
VRAEEPNDLLAPDERVRRLARKGVLTRIEIGRTSWKAVAAGESPRPIGDRLKA